MLFSKTEYKEIVLPFKYEREEIPFKDLPQFGSHKHIYEDSQIYRGTIGIEAYGNIFGENKYCYAFYSADENIIDEIVELFKNSPDRTVKVIFKIKKEKPKDFQIDLESFAKTYNYEGFKSLELLGWGLNDKSFEESE